MVEGVFGNDKAGTRLGNGERLTLNEVGHALLDARRTSAVAVGAHALHLLQQAPRPRDDVGRVAQPLEGLLMVEQGRVLEQRGDLAEEGERLLVELLRVADVCEDDVVEGQALALAGGDLGAQLLGALGDQAADGVLGGDDMLVDTGQAEDLWGGHGCVWRGGEGTDEVERETIRRKRGRETLRADGKQVNEMTRCYFSFYHFYTEHRQGYGLSARRKMPRGVRGMIGGTEGGEITESASFEIFRYRQLTVFRSCQKRPVVGMAVRINQQQQQQQQQHKAVGDISDR
jgi:hypothetical protein